RSIRNARSEARIEPAAWLAATVSAPADLLRHIQELAPAIGRLARLRPLRIAGPGRPLARPAGALAVVAGTIEASVEPPTVGAGDAGVRDRDRLRKELAEAEGRLAAATARLAEPRFLERAPAEVVEGARSSASELSAQVASLRDRLADQRVSPD